MSSIITSEFIELFKDYPPYSQDGLIDPLVIVKLFDIAGTGTWYLSEYNPQDQIAFGFVTGLGFDEWGYIVRHEVV